jgi:hypothetical protein
MRKFTIFAIVCLLGTAFSANATEAVQRKHGLMTHKSHHVRQTRQQTEPEPEKPAVTRLPVPPDTFRA